VVPPGMQSSIFGACPKPGYIGKVVAGRASGIKLGDDGGRGIDGPDWVASSQIVGTLASIIIFSMPHKIQNDDRLPQSISGVSG